MKRIFVLIILLFATSIVLLDSVQAEVKTKKERTGVGMSGANYQCPMTDELNEIGMWIEHAALLQGIGIDESEVERFTEKAKQVADGYGKLLAKLTPCAATEKDLYCALRVVEVIQKVGGEEGSDKLLQWTQEAFRAIAADVTTLTNQNGRRILADQAKLLGLMDLHNKIKAGGKVTTSCPLKWRINAHVSYECKMEGLKCSWSSTIDFPNVRLTGWRSLLGGHLPLLTSFLDYVSAPTISEQYAYHNGDKWIECSIDKTLVWQCGVGLNPGLGKPAGETGKIPLVLKLHPTQTELVSVCTDGVRSPLLGQDEIQGPWYISAEKVAEGKPFSVSEEKIHDDGVARATFKLTPVK